MLIMKPKQAPREPPKSLTPQTFEPKQTLLGTDDNFNNSASPAADEIQAAAEVLSGASYAEDVMLQDEKFDRPAEDRPSEQQFHELPLKSQKSLSDTETQGKTSVVHTTRKILTNGHFLLLLLNSVMLLFGIAVVFTHIIAFAESQGFSSAFGSTMVSVLGGSALVGRVALSSLSQQPWINSVVLHALAVFTCGGNVSESFKNTKHSFV